MNTVPVIRQYPFVFHELAHIVSELKELKKSGYPLEEVAILYAKTQAIGRSGSIA
ncbi:MAG: hypothetical protein R2769_01205 [Saprospiraceae bacterium]